MDAGIAYDRSQGMDKEIDVRVREHLPGVANDSRPVECSNIIAENKNRRQSDNALQNELV